MAAAPSLSALVVTAHCGTVFPGGFPMDNEGASLGALGPAVPAGEPATQFLSLCPSHCHSHLVCPSFLPFVILGLLSLTPSSLGRATPT